MNNRIKLPEGFKSELDELNDTVRAPWLVLTPWLELKQMFEILNHRRSETFPEIQDMIIEAYQKGGYRP